MGKKKNGFHRVNNRDILQSEWLLIGIGIVILLGVFNYQKVAKYFSPGNIKASVPIEETFRLSQLTSATGVEQVLDVGKDVSGPLALVSHQGTTASKGLYIYNLVTGAQKQKLSATTSLYARMAGRLAVWNDNGVIYQGANTPLTELTYKAVANTPVDIATSSYLAYVSTIGGVKKIVLYNTGTKKSVIINHTPIDFSAGLNLRVEGSRVFWTDKTATSPYHGLFVYDIGKKTIKQVSFGNQMDILSMEVSGNLAVGRVKTPNKPDNIYAYNAATGEILALSNDSNKKTDPWIYNGTQVVYFDYSRQNTLVSQWDYRLMIYDYSKKQALSLYEWKTPTSQTWAQPLFTVFNGKYYGVSAKLWKTSGVQQADVYGMVQN